MKLPVCPYCKTVYRYGDIRKQARAREGICYRCGKKFKISKKKILILFLILAAVGAAADIFELCMIGGVSFSAVFVTNIIIVSAGLFITPYFISFKKYEDSKEKNTRVKKPDLTDYNKKIRNKRKNNNTDKNTNGGKNFE